MAAKLPTFGTIVVPIGNLACIIFVSASKLRFNGSYSDELRSPQGLEILGDPNGGWFLTPRVRLFRYRDTHKKRDPNESLFCGANGNRTSDTRIFSPLLYQLSYGTALASELRVTRDLVARLRLFSVLRFSVCKRFAGLHPEETMRIVVFSKSGCKSTAFF